jgi:outer membrane receptor for ferrienterochelin and colicins
MRFWCTVAVSGALATALVPARAQEPAPADSASVRVMVTRDSAGGAAVEGAIVRSGRTGGQTDASGVVTLRLPPGAHTVVANRPGFRPDSALLSLRAGADTAVALVLVEQAAALDVVVVSATRGERRVEDTPLRIEVIDEDEIAEKVSMTPGDIAMMLNETSGLRVQSTNPSLGGANVRVQGLRGRYSLLLADGLPLYGGQAGGLGLLQIPPVDLARVEVIKGTASALYGSAALGGVINLVSRRPGETRAHDVLVNQTTRGGTDGVGFATGPLTDRWGYTVLAGAHRQRQTDLDDDGWTDMPGYRRVVLRPRFHFDDRAGRTAFVTGGLTAEQRDGGTMPGAVVPGGRAHAEALRTRRADVGVLARWVFHDTNQAAPRSPLHGAILTARASGVEQRHGHEFGRTREDDEHRTVFAEASLAAPRGAVTYVGGVAIQRDDYRSEQVEGVDYVFSVPSAFVQLDADPARWLTLSASARLDAHSVFGTFVNPRLSLLFRPAAHDDSSAQWTIRLSGGTGAFAPTPFTEETEATGLSPLAVGAAGWRAGLTAERARSAALDLGVPLVTRLGRIEVNLTTFGSRIAGPLQIRNAADTTVDGARRLLLANAPGPTRTWGAELLARLVRELGGAEGESSRDGEEPPTLRVTATYSHLRSTECDPDGVPGVDACARREVPLTPRHSAGVVATVEQHERGRVGLELYYVGRQALEQNPYRSASRPYVVVGLLGERAFPTRFGGARVFVNLENLGDVRQTKYDPLRLPVRGAGGRWATDAWTELTGFISNAGVRVAF